MTNRFGLTAEQAENLADLLRFAAGWIEDPGDDSDEWAPLHDDSLTLDDEVGSEGYGPTSHECPQPRVTRKWWAARAA
jgi:hypothetical protein